MAQTSGGRVAKLSYEERQRVADKREQVRTYTHNRAQALARRVASAPQPGAERTSSVSPALLRSVPPRQ